MPWALTFLDLAWILNLIESFIFGRQYHMTTFLLCYIIFNLKNINEIFSDCISLSLPIPYIQYIVQHTVWAEHELIMSTLLPFYWSSCEKGEHSLLFFSKYTFSTSSEMVYYYLVMLLILKSNREQERESVMSFQLCSSPVHKKLTEGSYPLGDSPTDSVVGGGGGSGLRGRIGTEVGSDCHVECGVSRHLPSSQEGNDFSKTVWYYQARLTRCVGGHWDRQLRRQQPMTLFLISNNEIWECVHVLQQQLLQFLEVLQTCPELRPTQLFLSSSDHRPDGKADHQDCVMCTAEFSPDFKSRLVGRKLDGDILKHQVWEWLVIPLVMWWPEILKPLGRAYHTHTWWYNRSPLSKRLTFKIKLLLPWEETICSPIFMVLEFIKGDFRLMYFF